MGCSSSSNTSHNNHGEIPPNSLISSLIPWIVPLSLLVRRNITVTEHTFGGTFGGVENNNDENYNDDDDEYNTEEQINKVVTKALDLQKLAEKELKYCCNNSRRDESGNNVFESINCNVTNPVKKFKAGGCVSQFSNETEDSDEKIESLKDRTADNSYTI